MRELLLTVGFFAAYLLVSAVVYWRTFRDAVPANRDRALLAFEPGIFVLRTLLQRWEK